MIERSAHEFYGLLFEQERPEPCLAKVVVVRERRN